MYVTFTVWCVDICIHCEMTTPIKLISRPITSHSHLTYLFSLCENFKICSLGMFQRHNIVLLTTATMLYIRFPEFIHPAQLQLHTL